MWPCERLRVADRGLREGILATLMAEDGVYRDRAPVAAIGGDRSATRMARQQSRRKRRQASGRRQLEGAPEDRRAAHGLLAALARAPAQRPLRGRGQARGLSLARGLQADRDRRQAPPAQAGQARRRSRRGARRLDPGGGASACASAEGRGQVVAIDLWRWSRSPASTFLRLDFMDDDRAGAAPGHAAGRPRRRRAVRHGRPGDRPHPHRPPAHHGAGGGGGRVRLRGARPRAGPSCARCSRAAPSASCWTG